MASVHYSPMHMEWAGVAFRRSDGSIVAYEFTHGASIEMTQTFERGHPGEDDIHTFTVTLHGPVVHWDKGAQQAPQRAEAIAEPVKAIAQPVKVLPGGREYRAFTGTSGAGAFRVLNIADAESYYRAGWRVQFRDGGGEWEDFS